MQLTAPIALIRDLLTWIAARPRTYHETLQTWRTSCPRLPVWEDALESGLLEVVPTQTGTGQAAVRITEKGRSLLDGW
jgi:hypothetical protein